MNLTLAQTAKSWTARFVALGAVFNAANAATANVDPQTLVGMFHLDPQWASVVTGIFAVLAIYNRANPKQGVPAQPAK